MLCNINRLPIETCITSCQRRSKRRNNTARGAKDHRLRNQRGRRSKAKRGWKGVVRAERRDKGWLGVFASENRSGAVPTRRSAEERRADRHWCETNANAVTVKLSRTTATANERTNSNDNKRKRWETINRYETVCEKISSVQLQASDLRVDWNRLPRRGLRQRFSRTPN